MKKMISALLLIFSLHLQAELPDWTDNAYIEPGEDRANIYKLPTEKLEEYRTQGYIHAMQYPVSVTGLLIPYRPLLNFMNNDSDNTLRKLLLSISRSYAGFGSEKEIYEWLGLAKHNGPSAQGIYKMPMPNGKMDQFYVGAGLIKNSQGEGLTFSCFACHATNLFGTTVMGLTNKNPRSNKFFHMARKIVPLIPETVFYFGTNSSKDELNMFRRTKKNLLSIDGVVPQVLGLDTSLPHVALSLSRRNNDEFATKNTQLEKYPRENSLRTIIADSKPMPWWNLKYKTRWLSDGSIVSGNPIFTNILWNEIGRGTDLVELKKWMESNPKIIEEMTAAVFANKAPLYTDFFPAESISLERAKRGEKLFNQTCLKCHGEYQKAWNEAGNEHLPLVEKLKTTKVIYHEQTPVINVDTDPNRWEATKYFADELNNLAVSKWMGTKIEPQEGYVPPPLVGIWSRYPYFHNNSVPHLCGVLSLVKDRPASFIAGPAENKLTDFDQECNGYPVGEKIPDHWKKNKEFFVKAFFDTKKIGLRNMGHEKMLLNDNGKEKFSIENKKDLIIFLKTL